MGRCVLLRFKRFAAAFLFAAALFSVQAYAGMSVSCSEEVSTEKTIRWWSDDENAELRYMKGSGKESDFNNAAVAGSGSASISVEDNGNYTVFAKAGDTVYCDIVTVTNIDRGAPDIVVTNMDVNTDGTVNVYYEASDYFSSCETRYSAGSLSASAWNAAQPMSGGVIKGLKSGTYTLFAKDEAGNVGIYILEAAGSRGESSSSEEKNDENEWSYRDHYAGTSLETRLVIPNRIIIRKCDASTNELISGAKLRLSAAGSGDVIEEWVTDGKDKSIIGLNGSTEYVLEEVSAPDGYYTASEIRFLPTELTDGMLVMYDERKSSGGGTSGGGTSVLMTNPAPETTAPAPDSAVHPPETTAPAPGASVSKTERLPQTGGLDDMAMTLLLGFALVGIGAYGLKATRRNQDEGNDSEGN